MSLTSPKLITPFIALAVAGVFLTSCGEHRSPLSPSAVTSFAPQQLGVIEEILVDDTPPPGRAGPQTSDDPVEPPPPPPPGSGPTPWPPGDPPRAQPGVPVPTPPSTHPRVTMKIDPDPVPYSGVPIPIFSCRDNRHTWYYDQVIHTTSGVGVTMRERQNFFDGRFTSKNASEIKIPGNSTVTLRTRWCSAYPKPHYTQTRYMGVDENNEPFTISGPWARLLTPR